MRIMITTLHVHPMVPIARALEAAGHEVVVACAEDNRPALTAIGLRFVPAGTSMAAVLPQVLPQLGALPPAQRDAWVLGHVFGDLLPARIVPDLLALCRSWKPDLLIRDAMEFGGCLVAEHLGLPHASLELGMFLPQAWVAQCAGAALDRLRTSLGLPPDPDLAMLYRYLHLAFVPPRYQDPAVVRPPTAHALRTVVFDRSGDEELPEWVTDLRDRPVIYATLGSVFNHRADLFETILAALRDEPGTLVVTLGRDQDPTPFGPQPPTVHLARYIPQSLLLPHCDLVVCHGGWNTVLAALRVGLPLVLLPLGADQPYHAARCAAVQVGRVVDEEERTPAGIRAAVRTVLRAPAYRQRAVAIKAEMDALPGLEQAVALLERLAAECRPLSTA